jgi:hypothetical protein
MEATETPTAEGTPGTPVPPTIPTATFDIVAPWSGAEFDTDFVTVWVILDYEEADGIPVVTINGEPAIMVDDTTAYLNVSLLEGENIINVTAVDPAGSVVSDDVFVTYTPPVEGTLPLAVFYPPDGLAVDDTQIMVIGGTSPDAEVTVNGVPATVDADGMFLSEADLLASDYVLEVVASATNVDGQEITTSLSLMLEEFIPEETPEPGETPEATGTPDAEETPEATGTPDAEETPEATGTPDAEETPEATGTPDAEETPEATGTPDAEETGDLTAVEVLSPGADAEVETPVITVLLQVLDDVIVRVNDELVEISEDGYAQTDVMLTEGENDIEIEASNFSSGISESATFTVTYEPTDFDDLPLSIYYPSDDVEVSEPEITIVGGTTADATVEVDGTEVEVSEDGTFSMTVTLGVGENEIEITATDDPLEESETIIVTYEP